MAGLVSLVSLVSGVSPAYAGGDGLTWTVTQTSGNVQYRMGGTAPTGWQALPVGAVLGAAAEVRTGASSRALLTHRGTTLTVSPESALTLPGSERPKGVYRVFQSLGTLLYRIKERAAAMAAFEVETPYLVAVVKGTVFTVNASADGAAVHLTEGIVDVQPTLGGIGATLTPGRTARITAVPGADVIVKGQDAGKRSNVTPPKGKGKDNGGAATPSGENASEDAKARRGKGVTISGSAKSNSGRRGRHPRNETLPDGKGDSGAVTSFGEIASEGAKARRDKGVTISRSAKSNSGRRGRHPRAVAIFASNNRGGLFAKGVNVENAFKRKRGRHGSSNHGGRVSDVARDLAINGGADVSAKAKDGGVALGTDNEGGGLSSNSGSGGGGLSSGGGDLSSNSGSGGGGLSSNSGSGGGGLSSGGG
ncbi:MAG: FecR domain-containing protein, partial [Rhodospirillales bacterium]